MTSVRVQNRKRPRPLPSKPFLPSLHSVTATPGNCIWRLSPPTPVLCLFIGHRFYSPWTSYISSLIPTFSCQNANMMYQLRDLLLDPMHKKEWVKDSNPKGLLQTLMFSFYICWPHSCLLKGNNIANIVKLLRVSWLFLNIEAWICNFHTANMYMCVYIHI